MYMYRYGVEGKVPLTIGAGNSTSVENQRPATCPCYILASLIDNPDLLSVQRLFHRKMRRSNIKMKHRAYTDKNDIRAYDWKVSRRFTNSYVIRAPYWKLRNRINPEVLRYDVRMQLLAPCQ